MPWRPAGGGEVECGHAEEPGLAGVEAGPGERVAGCPLLLGFPSATPKNLQPTYSGACPEHLPAPRDKLA